MILSKFRRILNTYPLIANITTFACLTTSADICCQVIEHNGLQQFNWTRLKNMTCIGAFYYGPLSHYYLRFLDRKLPGNNPRTVLMKMFIDQVIIAIPSYAAFYILMGKMEHKTWEESKAELKTKYLPTYMTSFLFWPLAQGLNFAFIPPVFRVVYVSGAVFIWMIFLSYIKNRPKLPTLLQKIEDYTTGIKEDDTPWTKPCSKSTVKTLE